MSDGKSYYEPFFAVFPFSFKSDGMKAYTVYDVSDGRAHIKEVTGTIPGGTPVIIVSNTSAPSTNRLNIGGTATTVSGNLLKGVYFDNSSLLHKNQVPYDKATMRLLGKLSDGSIGFKTVDVQTIPRNEAYLVVPAGSPNEIPLTTEAPAVKVSGITLSKTWLSLHKGDSESITATVLPANANNKSLTWSSDKPEIATVDANGKITAVSLGQAAITVTANDGSGVKAICYVNVTNPLATSITLDKETATIRVRKSIKLNATITPADALQTVKWSSAADSVATVDNQGNVYGVSPGKVAIIAAVSDETRLYKICVVTVEPALAESVTLDKQEIAMTVGDSQTLTATVLPDDAGNRNVTWQSSATGVVSVGNDGKLTALSAGTAVVTATTTDGSNLTASCKVTVSPAKVESVTLNVHDMTLTVGDSQTLTATVLPDQTTNRTVTWQSSADDVVSVTNEGKVTALAEGTAIITALAADGSGASDKCTITVERVRASSINIEPTTATVDKGKGIQLQAVILPTEALQVVDWASQDSSIASVDSNGNVNGLTVGQTVISATTVDGSNLTAYCQLNVNDIGAVEGISAEVFTVGVENGSEIVISGVNDDEVVRVITTAGAEVYNGTSKRISALEKGVYLVVVKTTVTKVSIH